MDNSEFSLNAFKYIDKYYTTQNILYYNFMLFKLTKLFSISQALLSVLLNETNIMEKSIIFKIS